VYRATKISATILKTSGIKLSLLIIWIYKNCISPLTPPSCRFYPTCSAYAKDAILKFGALRGAWMTLKRLAKCHPFYRGCLYDPVPDTEKQKHEAKPEPDNVPHK